MTKGLLRLALILSVVAAGLLAPVTGTTPASPAQAADTRFFDAGNIISDAVFFDSLSMDAPAVQAFLNVKGSSCTRGDDGSACLKNYVVSTTNRTADAWCPGGYVGAGAESAARIIVNVSRSCGVNPRVLLVLLEKEQGLVRSTNPTAKKYTKAAGYACPDTGNGCDPAYAGLENQLYNAARQFQRYADGLAGTYRAGRVNSILWHPDAGCGRSDVYIVNTATAGLYNYTPYRPNQAALNAGSGTGDSCSSYGNRNFWNYFTDWFGSTQSPGGTAILNRYTELGGPTGMLGATASGITCGLLRGGCGQLFANGSIYWSPESGPLVIRGNLRDRWAALGWERSTLGYPVTDSFCGLAGGGCYQVFQGGSLYATSSTAVPRLVRGVIRAVWGTTGFETGSLGYPLSDEYCGLRGGGCYNSFQRGLMYWTNSTGAVPILERMVPHWAQLGFENSWLGYPVKPVVCGLANGGCRQEFQGGTLYDDATAGSFAVAGPIRDYYNRLGAQDGALGYPTADQTCGLVRSGCTQTFSGGTLAYSPGSGVHLVRGTMATGWSSLGSQGGTLGYPLTDSFCGLSNSGCYQVFEGGSLYWTTGTGAHFVRGAIREVWGVLGWETSGLGYPTSDEQCSNGACVSTFTGGVLVYTRTGAVRIVSGDVLAAWTALGRNGGTLGQPQTDTFCGLVDSGCYQVFEGGSLYWTAGSGAHVVRGAIRAEWARLGWETSALGYPTSDEQCSNGACISTFTGGVIYYTGATGAHAVSGDMATAWTARGGGTGPLGYPLADVQTSGTVLTQRFQGGTLTLDTSTGTVTGP